MMNCNTLLTIVSADYSHTAPLVSSEDLSNIPLLYYDRRPNFEHYYHIEPR